MVALTHETSRTHDDTYKAVLASVFDAAARAYLMCLGTNLPRERGQEGRREEGYAMGPNARLVDIESAAPMGKPITLGRVVKTLEELDTPREKIEQMVEAVKRG
jgi:hypothetical protein